MVETFDQALKFLFSHIPQTDGKKFPGELGLARMEALMQELGNPQNQYRVIHIAGTSGKGSTATLTSTALVSQGFHVGLQLSPHLLDIRERVQIDNSFISKDAFVNNLNAITPAVEKTSHGQFGQVSYFEILVALAYFTFWKKKVDYAVIETGMGGLYDGTNVVSRPDKIAVITKIGFDHMAVLGNTLPEIASQKAGIIQSGNIVITAPQEASVSRVLEDRAEKMGAKYTPVVPSDSSITSISKEGTVFIDNKRNRTVTLSLIGAHQAQNAQVTEEIVYTVAQQDDWEINESKLDRALYSARLPGRMDIVQYRDKELIIDGAHNTQKMDAFLSALENVFGKEKHTFLVAFKHGKDISAMIEAIEPYAKEIIVTDFWVDKQDMLNISEPAETVASYVKNVPVTTVSGTDNALKAALALDKKLIITGSLYFASEIYKLLK